MDLRISQIDNESAKRSSSFGDSLNMMAAAAADSGTVGSSFAVSADTAVEVESNVKEHSSRTADDINAPKLTHHTTESSESVNSSTCDSPLHSLSGRDANEVEQPMDPAVGIMDPAATGIMDPAATDIMDPAATGIIHNDGSEPTTYLGMIKEEQSNLPVSEQQDDPMSPTSNLTEVKEILADSQMQGPSACADTAVQTNIPVRPTPVYPSQGFTTLRKASAAASSNLVSNTGLVSAPTGKSTRNAARRRKALSPKRALISCPTPKVTKTSPGRKGNVPRGEVDTGQAAASMSSPRVPSFTEQVHSVCAAFGGAVSYVDQDYYVRCTSLLSLYPRIKWRSKRSVIVKVVLDIFSVYNLPEEMRVLQSFGLDLEDDVQMKVEAYLMLIIRSYKDITKPDKPKIHEVMALYVSLLSDRQDALVDMLSQLKLDKKQTRKNIGPKSSKAVICPPGFPAAEWSGGSSQRSCSSQTDGGVQASYLRTLSLKEQLSNPSVIRKVAWVVQSDKQLNEVFWKAYNEGSSSTINRVPNILTGDGSMVCDVKTQTEPASVPVLQLKRLGCGSPSSVKMSRSDLNLLQNNQNRLLDFVPNYGSTEKMDELFHSINANNYSDRWEAPQYEDIVGAKYATSFHDVPVIEKAAATSTLVDIDIAGSGGQPDCLTVESSAEEGELDFSAFWTVADLSDETYEPVPEPKPKRVRKQRAQTKTAKKPRTTNAPSTPKLPKYKVAAPEDRLCVLCDKMLEMHVNKGSCCPSHRLLVGTRYPEEKSKKEYVYTYSCPQCSYQSHQLVKMKSHVLIVHKGEDTQYKCEVCGKSLSCLKMFKRHKASHMAVKPFMCETCGKGFSQPNNLEAHRRQHTGEKPFQCEHCGNSFTHNVSLRKHFCKTLGRRIEPLDLKTPGKGRPVRRGNLPPPVELARQEVQLNEEPSAPSEYVAPFLSVS